MLLNYKCYYLAVDLKITHLKWMTNYEDLESMVVGTKYSGGSFIEIWTLVERVAPLHPHFKAVFQQLNKTELYKTVVRI